MSKEMSVFFNDVMPMHPIDIENTLKIIKKEELQNEENPNAF